MLRFKIMTHDFKALIQELNQNEPETQHASAPLCSDQIRIKLWQSMKPAWPNNFTGRVTTRLLFPFY